MSEPTPEPPPALAAGVQAWAQTQPGGMRPLALLVSGLAEQVEALAVQVAALVEALTSDPAPEPDPSTPEETP